MGGIKGGYGGSIGCLSRGLKVVKSKNKPHFVTAILAIEFVFLVYFFVGGS